MSTALASHQLPNTDNPPPDARHPHPDAQPGASTALSDKYQHPPTTEYPSTPELHLNGKPAANAPTSYRSAMSAAGGGNDGWGANFWVTLVDPQTQVSFFACPASGEVSWDPPVGNFLLPPNPDGEWWEMIDESSGLPYYYQTKTGETVWDRPEAFVIPLTTLQNTALGRRLSVRRISTLGPMVSGGLANTADRVPYRRSNSYITEKEVARQQQRTSFQQRRSQSSARNSPVQTASSSANTSPNTGKKVQSRRPQTGQSNEGLQAGSPSGPLAYPRGHPLAPIPGSPYSTDASTPPSPVARRSLSSTPVNGVPIKNEKARDKDSSLRRKSTADDSALNRSRSKSSTYLSYRAPQPQSLTAALEMIALSNSQSSASTDKPHTPTDSGHGHETVQPRGHMKRASTPGFDSRLVINTSPSLNEIRTDTDSSPPVSPVPTKSKGKKSGIPPSPSRPIPSLPHALGGGEISSPVYNPEASHDLSPMMAPRAAKPIPVDIYRRTAAVSPSLNTGKYPGLPYDLASDIQQFSESQFAKQYFSTHRTGFIFRRKVPVEQMMTWQKAPLNSPLLLLNRNLHKNALKTFKVIQHIMGDRDRDRPVGVRVPSDNYVSTVHSINSGSATSLATGPASAILEEERWLLGEGLTHGELRDEIYCQVTKQLNGNPNAESTFKGWQLLCVLLVTFPPSKNFETSLRSYMQQATSQQEGRVDVMAKYCLRRLAYISKKGPRGKPPSIAEIETASDAAFHPSIFGESLDGIFRLQERTYPDKQVPIILPFLADGILALGGTRSEGIFRVPGDGDAVSELKLRIEKGYYSLDGVDDPHVLASLLKLWLRELCDPLVPDELYNDCITHAHVPEACVQLVQRLPTINRRVILFVISFLQLFLEDKIQAITKMTSANLALVMAPNLLRCNSESISVVFTNAQYEQAFVHSLLLYLKCHEVDPDYVPAHGQGAITSAPAPLSRTSKSRRRPNH
ncbi:hypothetical protein B0H21DRAFT_744108 [Amylocystis lapponica]|nr:hypothetical protein B0H21DRAFT_744108 [Amylocystis lapponica]